MVESGGPGAYFEFQPFGDTEKLKVWQRDGPQQVHLTIAQQSAYSLKH